MTSIRAVATTNPKGAKMGTLELRREVGGLRHYLDGQPVHAGDTLEWNRAGEWLRGRYEWTFREDDQPAFYISEDKGYFIPPDALLCWPRL